MKAFYQARLHRQVRGVHNRDCYNGVRLLLKSLVATAVAKPLRDKAVIQLRRQEQYLVPLQALQT